MILGQNGAMTDGATVPIVELDQAPSPPRRTRRTRRTIGAIGIVAVLLVGGFGAIALRGGAGGASSPEAAVRQLAKAIDNEDVLAAVDVLAPAEVADLRETVDAGRQRAADLKLVQSSGAPFAGIDASVQNLQLSVDELVDGFAKVTISGTIRADANSRSFSPYLRDVLGAKSTSGTFDLSQMSINGNKPFVMVVRSGGNWYVSPAYTAFESLRLAEGLPGADLGSAVQTRDLGAATPDDAVQQLVRAIRAGDWPKVASLADPEGFPVYDYRAAFTKLMADSIGTPSFTVDRLTTRSTVNGNRATVDLDVSGTYDSATEGPQPWSISRGCFKSVGTADQVGMDGTNADVCAGRLGMGYLAVFGGSPTSGAAPNLSLATVRRDGRWFVAPATTAFAAVRTWINQIDERTLAMLVNRPQALPLDGTLTLGRPQPIAAARAYRYTLKVDAPTDVVAVVADNQKMTGFVSIYKDGEDVSFSAATPLGTALEPGVAYDVVVQVFSSPPGELTVFAADQAPDWAKRGFYGDDTGSGGSFCMLGSNEATGATPGEPATIPCTSVSPTTRATTGP